MLVTAEKELYMCLTLPHVEDTHPGPIRAVAMQVADTAAGQERGYVGASVYRGHMSLMRLISALPRLRSLDLRKHPDAAPGSPSTARQERLLSA